MRIRIINDSEWGLGLYDDVGELLDENTRSGAIDGACLSMRQILPTLERAVKHSNMTEELADFSQRQQSRPSAVSRPAFLCGNLPSGTFLRPPDFDSFVTTTEVN
jgi:hypothetical protein